LASLIPSGEKRNVEDAALVNGAAAHVLDYDDVTLDGHPSAVLVPALFAQAEAVGATGRQVLEAYIVGYEIWAELLLREPTPLHDKGWHPTCVRGTVGAAGACARLLGLPADGIATAIAIAGSMAGGLVANFGTMTKAFQVGRAASNAIIAARMAKAGLSAAKDAMEHKAGYLAAFSPQGRAERDRALDPAGIRDWQIASQGLHLKRYPLCYATHRTIDAMLDVIAAHDLQPGEVEAVTVFTHPSQMSMLRTEFPKTAFAAKFSMAFAVAAALVERSVGLAQLNDALVLSPAMQVLYPRVRYEWVSETLDGSAFAAFDAVEVVCKDGRRLRSADIRFAKGSYQRPMTAEELFQKFSDCLGPAVPPATQRATFEQLMTLERQERVPSLVACAS
jgi:2-methylcitrate dehydratase PrpD